MNNQTMKKQILLAAVLLLVIVIAFLSGRASSPTSSAMMEGSTSGSRQVLYWYAPMDPNFRSDNPGKSPMGMDLVPKYAGEVEGQLGVVAIDPTMVNNLGVRTALAERSSLSRLIDTVGYVSYDEDTMHHIHTRVDGWIEKLVTNASGDPVAKGQLLFELYSPTLVSAQEEYLAALRSSNLVLRNASRNRLVALGVTSTEIRRLDKERSVRQRIPVYAMADGVVASLGVRHGMFVTPSIEVMSIASLDSIWVLAEVFERQAAWVKSGQPATVNLDYLPGETLRGTVDYVYPELDPKTRTLTVRLRFDNEELSLRPNMFARVSIQGEGVGEVVHVPREALIRGGSVNRVVVDLGNGRFRSRAVTIGIESGDRIEIREGLSAGERVVISAQFLIDSESNIGAALDRFDDSEARQ